MVRQNPGAGATEVRDRSQKKIDISSDYDILGARERRLTKDMLTSQLHSPAPPGTLPLLAGPWNAGFVEIVWVTEDSTKSEVRQRQWTVVVDIKKVPLQGFLQCSRRACHDGFSAALRLKNRIGHRVTDQTQSHEEPGKMSAA